MKSIMKELNLQNKPELTLRDCEKGETVVINLNDQEVAVGCDYMTNGEITVFGRDLVSNGGFMNFVSLPPDTPVIRRCEREELYKRKNK